MAGKGGLKVRLPRLAGSLRLRAQRGVRLLRGPATACGGQAQSSLGSQGLGGLGGPALCVAALGMALHQPLPTGPQRTPTERFSAGARLSSGPEER